MSSTTIIVLAILMVLAFWLVGAYNRLMNLRNTIVAMFAPVDEQFRARQVLLREQIEAIAADAADAPDAGPLDALNAALSQAEAACAHARSHPGAAGATRSLRLADEILDAARARLPAGALAAPALADVNQRLAVAQASLDFTRRRFNEAVSAYNDAMRQFPTGVAAAIFGFRPAGIV